ncbi:hypothetical protein OROMI_006826 [Orobanche minor]
MFDRVTDIEVDTGPFWNADPWIEHIIKENVLEVLDTQWLSASSLIFYIRKHRVLVAINTTTESIYFMDPAPMTTIAKYRSLKALVENAMRCFRTNCGRSCTRTAFNAFKWTTIQYPKQLTSDGIS